MHFMTPHATTTHGIVKQISIQYLLIARLRESAARALRGQAPFYIFIYLFINILRRKNNINKKNIDMLIFL